MAVGLGVQFLLCGLGRLDNDRKIFPARMKIQIGQRSHFNNGNSDILETRQIVILYSITLYPKSGNIYMLGEGWVNNIN